MATYQAGSTILVSWNTAILHPYAPGVRIAVQYDNSTDGAFNNNILLNNNNIGVLGLNTVSVTLPANKTSNNAVIQWIWASTSDGGYYLGCSDIQIIDSGNPSPPMCAATIGNTFPGSTSNVIFSNTQNPTFSSNSNTQNIVSSSNTQFPTFIFTGSDSIPTRVAPFPSFSNSERIVITFWMFLLIILLFL